MHKKSYIFLTSGIIGLLFLLSTPLGVCEVVTDTVDLAYNAEEAVKITPKVKVDWSFSGSNPNVNITLLRYTEKCYLASSWHSEISTGQVSASGTWDVPLSWMECQADTSEIPPYYFVFVNDDPDHESTTLTYSLDVDPFSIPGYNGLFLISVLAIAVFLVVRKKLK